MSVCFILVLQNDEERDVATQSFLFKVQADLLPAGTGKLSRKASLKEKSEVVSLVQLFIDAYQL